MIWIWSENIRKFIVPIIFLKPIIVVELMNHDALGRRYKEGAKWSAGAHAAARFSKELQEWDNCFRVYCKYKPWLIMGRVQLEYTDKNILEESY